MNILSSIISSSILSFSALDDPVHEVPESDATERLTLSLFTELAVGDELVMVVLCGLFLLNL